MRENRCCLCGVRPLLQYQLRPGPRSDAIIKLPAAGLLDNLIRSRAGDAQPELPKINVSELSMIKVGEIEEVPPPNPYGISAFQYTVEFTKAGSVAGILSGSGHTLYINLRDGQIEVVGTSVWMS